MVITPPPDVAEALAIAAAQRGTTPEALALETLRRAFVSSPRQELSREEWLARLDLAASDCGVVPPPSAFTSEELYD